MMGLMLAKDEPNWLTKFLLKRKVQLLAVLGAIQLPIEVDRNVHRRVVNLV